MNVTEVLDALDIPYDEAGDSPQATVGWISAECPWCGQGTNKRGLGFCLDGRKVCHCWRCGAHSVINALIEITGKPYRELSPLLGDLSPDDSLPQIKKRGKLVLPKGIGPLLKPHIDYLRSREFNPKELVNLWGLQGIGVAAALAWRIFIPFTYQNETVSWTTRSLSDKNHADRYRSAKPEQESIPMSELLWGEEFARHAVVVCEGTFDAMKVGPGAVAIMGLRCSSAQQLRLSKYSLRAVCYDAEAEAQKRARRLCASLSVLPGKTVNVMLDAKDPGSASLKEIKKLRREFLS